MNNATAVRPRLQGNYETAQPAKHPIREEIEKHLGVYDITATFEEDIQTSSVFNHPGLIAYLCTLKIGQKVIGQGRGMSVLSQSNRYIANSAKFAFSSALTDACVRAGKFPNAFVQGNDEPVPSFGLGSDAYSASVYQATDKQKSYLKELIDMKVDDEEEKNALHSNLDTMSKEEASELIQQLKS
jgi:hypothetical protein